MKKYFQSDQYHFQHKNFHNRFSHLPTLVTFVFTNSELLNETSQEVLMKISTEKRALEFFKCHSVHPPLWMMAMERRAWITRNARGVLNHRHMIHTNCTLKKLINRNESRNSTLVTIIRENKVVGNTRERRMKTHRQILPRMNVCQKI